MDVCDHLYIKIVYFSDLVNYYYRYFGDRIRYMYSTSYATWMRVTTFYLVHYYYRYIGVRIRYMYSTSYATWLCVSTSSSSMSISAILLTTTISTSVIGSGTCIAPVTPHG